MAFTYNQIGINYNDSNCSYNGLSFDLSIDIFDTLQISEFSNPTEVFYIDVSDDLTISEDVTITLDIYPIFVYDNIETQEILVFGLDLVDISVSDFVDISENFLRDEGFIYLSVFDETDISEDTTTNNELTDVFIYETVLIQGETLREMINGDIIHGEDILISDNDKVELYCLIKVSDQLDISDNLTETGNLYLSTFDILNISDVVTLSNPNLGDIVEFETLQITDSPNVSIQSDVKIYDSILITEYFSSESFRFSPSNIKPVAKGRDNRPGDGKLAGFF